MQKEVKEMVEGTDVDLINLIFGTNLTTEDFVKTLTDLGQTLQAQGMEWK